MKATRIILAAVLICMTAGASWCLSVQAGPASAGPNCNTADAHGATGGNGGNGMLTLSDDDLKRELAAASAAGMRYIRIDVDWSQIEATRGQRDWTSTDRLVNEVIAQGMCPLGLVTYAPQWAADPADNPSDTHFRPQDPSVFAEFAKDAAARYEGRVGVWEVWNEPNLTDFYRPAPDVAGYAALLQATYSAIKSVDKNIVVVSGGLSPAEDNDGDIAPLTFLSGLYAAHANANFDAVGMHPYTFPALPDDPDTASTSAFQQMWLMHEVMANGGDGGKKIWLTEFGAPTGSAADAVSDAVQAETIRIVLQAAKTVPWMGPAFVYSIRDAGVDPADREQNFGLLRQDFTEKPAYEVFRRFAIGTP